MFGCRQLRHPVHLMRPRSGYLCKAEICKRPLPRSISLAISRWLRKATSRLKFMSAGHISKARSCLKIQKPERAGFARRMSKDRWRQDIDLRWCSCIMVMQRGSNYLYAWGIKDILLRITNSATACIREILLIETQKLPGSDGAMRRKRGISLLKSSCLNIKIPRLHFT